MKNYIHARLTPEEKKYLSAIKKCSGFSESEVIKKGLYLVYTQEVIKRKNFLDLTGDLVGCLSGGPSDLSTNKKYFEGFGED